MIKKKSNYTKLLDIDCKYLIDYLSEMIVEHDDDFQYALEHKDREYLESIIKRHIY